MSEKYTETRLAGNREPMSITSRLGLRRVKTRNGCRPTERTTGYGDVANGNHPANPITTNDSARPDLHAQTTRRAMAATTSQPPDMSRSTFAAGWFGV